MDPKLLCSYVFWDGGAIKVTDDSDPNIVHASAIANAITALGMACDGIEGEGGCEHIRQLIIHGWTCKLTLSDDGIVITGSPKK